MPALPWKSLRPVDPHHEYVVMASRLPLAHYRHVPAFLRATVAIQTQLASADGLVGYALNAKLLRKTFLTVSVWHDDAALGGFAHADPHRERVARIRSAMRPTTFVTWRVPGNDLTSAGVPWGDAEQRIREAGA
jgi:hypothetical protein